MTTRYSPEQVETIVAQNMGLVVSLVKSLRPPNDTEFDEYVQLGSIGLWKAIVKHNPERAKLSTVAWDYIRWEIIKYIAKRQRYNKMMSSHQLHTYCEIRASERSVGFQPQELPQLLPTNLSTRERTIVDMRNQGYTFAEIGETLGYTRDWANKLFKVAIKKIRDANQEADSVSQ